MKRKVQPRKHKMETEHRRLREANAAANPDMRKGGLRGLQGLKGDIPGNRVSSVEVVSCREVQYTCEIALGVPHQYFEVILDTGSSDLWVLDVSYENGASSEYRAIGDPFEITYGDGTSVKGFTSLDIMTWGGMEIKNQVFAEIEDAANFQAGCTETGLLGLSFDAHAHTEAPGPFHQLVHSGKLVEPMFSLLLVDDAGGVLTLGGTNWRHYEGNLHWFSVVGLDDDAPYDDDDDFYFYYQGDDDTLSWTDDVYPTGRLRKWEILLDSVTVGGNQASVSQSTAVIDTGTTYTLTPRADFIQVATDMGADCWYGNKERNCRKTPSMPFTEARSLRASLLSSTIIARGGGGTH